MRTVPPRKPDVIPEGSKWCPRCQRVKPVVAFYERRKPKYPSARYSGYCRACNGPYRSGLWAEGRVAPNTREKQRLASARYRAKPRSRDIYWARVKTPRGRMVQRRSWVGRELRKPDLSRARRRRLEARLAQLERDLRALGWEPREAPVRMQIAS